MEISLSEDQEVAYKSIIDWFENQTAKKPSISLGGYAGTGKSTVISYFIKNYIVENGLNFRTMAFTGKAVSVLRRKGVESNTIHSTIYATLDKEKLEEYIMDYVRDGYTQQEAYEFVRGGVDRADGVFWIRRRPIELSHVDLFIVDESSMVPLEIFKDLLSFNIPILFVGDHGQLPPVDNSNKNFSVMLNHIS